MYYNLTPGCDSVNNGIQKWMNQGEQQLTADIVGL